MELKRKLLIGALTAAPLVGGGTAAWLATVPSAGAQSLSSTATSSATPSSEPTTGSEEAGATASADPVGTAATTDVQVGTTTTTAGGTDGTTAEPAATVEPDSAGGHQDLGTSATSTGGVQQ